jgi:hypothetical protein
VLLVREYVTRNVMFYCHVLSRIGAEVFCVEILVNSVSEGRVEDEEGDDK